MKVSMSKTKKKTGAQRAAKKQKAIANSVNDKLAKAQGHEDAARQMFSEVKAREKRDASECKMCHPDLVEDIEDHAKVCPLHGNFQGSTPCGGNEKSAPMCQRCSALQARDPNIPVGRCLHYLTSSTGGATNGSAQMRREEGPRDPVPMETPERVQTNDGLSVHRAQDIHPKEVDSFNITSWHDTKISNALVGASALLVGGATLLFGGSWKRAACSVAVAGTVGYALKRAVGAIFALKGTQLGISLNVPEVTTSEMVNKRNEGVSFHFSDILSSQYYTAGAQLIGQKTQETAGRDVRPAKHAASKCNREAKLQLWRMNVSFVSKHLIVNGALFSELVSQNYGKPYEAVVANIIQRTNNPADYNVDPNVQAIVNRDTAELALMFFKCNFMQLNFQ